MVDINKASETVNSLQSILYDIQSLKTGERSEEQRRIAILTTKIEDALAWSMYTFEVPSTAQATSGETK